MLAPNESFCVSSLAALREVNSLKSSMTKSQAEATLTSFVAKGWLMKSRCGTIPIPVDALPNTFHADLAAIRSPPAQSWNCSRTSGQRMRAK